MLSIGVKVTHIFTKLSLIRCKCVGSKIPVLQNFSLRSVVNGYPICWASISEDRLKFIERLESKSIRRNDDRTMTEW